jgi:Domain of unknown function (DUF4336)
MQGIQAFARDVWTVEGPVVRDFGVDFTTRMTVVKLSDGTLWVDSPVPVSFDLLSAVAALGPPAHVVSATPRHVWRLGAWHGLFPQARLWTPKRSPLTLGGPALPAGTLADGPQPDWSADLDQVAFKGNPLIEEVVFLHRESRTLIMDDLIQIHAPAAGRPLRNALSRFGGVAAPEGGVPVDIRLSFIHRGAARRCLATLLSWDFDKLIIAHGPCVESGAKDFVRRAFRWLA